MIIFTEEQSKQIVDTLLSANNIYLQEKQEKSKKMVVSRGYSWVRSNIIDNTFVKAKLDFIFDSKIEKAGESWQYAKFYVQHEEYGKILLLIKKLPTLLQLSQYLLNYAKSNRSFINEITSLKDSKDVVDRMDENIQLSLDVFQDEDDIVNLDFDKFFVITYDLDEDGQINSVMLKVISERGEVYNLQDLSQYIYISSVSPIQIGNEEIKGLPEVIDNRVFYGVPPKEKEMK